jgi:hypothetical protein
MYKKMSLRVKKSTEIQAPLDVSALGLFTAAADLALSNESTYHKGGSYRENFFWKRRLSFKYSRR